VRLKVTVFCTFDFSSTTISIPFGAIKSPMSYFEPNDYFISIPFGAIKSFDNKN